MSIEVNDYSFKTVQRGHGAPLVFVHGSASDYRTWQVQQDQLASHFHTINYSRRYHWPNKPIAQGADYAMAEHVDDLAALLCELDATPAHLVGHSYGALVCLLLAVRAPELVRTLVIAEPPAITLFVSNRPKPAEILRLLLSRPRTAVAIIKFGATGVAPTMAAMKRDDMEEALRLFGTATLGTDTFVSLSVARREQARANLIKAELFGSGFPPLDDRQLRRIQVPTLLVSGQLSRRLFQHLLDRLEELLPRTTRIEVPGASHIMHEDNPSAYNAELLSFLRGTVSSTPPAATSSQSDQRP